MTNMNDTSSMIGALRSLVLTNLRSYSVKVSAEHQPFTLASGGISRLYVDAKKTFLHRTMHGPVSALLLELVKLFGVVDALAGVALGGCHLASIVAARAALGSELLYNVIYIRKFPKDHGTRMAVETAWMAMGVPPRIVVLEDVISTGKTSAAACQTLVKEGYAVQGVVALLDRRVNRTDGLVLDTALQRYVPVFSVFTLDDLELSEEITRVR